MREGLAALVIFQSMFIWFLIAEPEAVKFKCSSGIVYVGKIQRKGESNGSIQER